MRHLMIKRILKSTILVSALSTSLILANANVAQANWVCRWFPHMCNDKDDGSGKPSGSGRPSVLPATSEYYRYLNLGYSNWQQKNFSTAANNYKNAVKIARNAKEQKNIAIGYVGLAEVNMSTGKKRAAIAYLNRALKLFQAEGDSQSVRKVKIILRQIRLGNSTTQSIIPEL